MKYKALIVGLMAIVLAGCSNETIRENETVATQDTTIENEQQTEQSIIEIKDEHFIEQMEMIYADVDAYEGKTVSYEGFVVQVDEAGKEYTVARTHELDHDDHGHTILVGLYATYNKEWPEEDSWVKVTGKIQKQETEAGISPVLNIEKIEVMATRGEEQVYS